MSHSPPAQCGRRLSSALRPCHLQQVAAEALVAETQVEEPSTQALHRLIPEVTHAICSPSVVFRTVHMEDVWERMEY